MKKIRSQLAAINFLFDELGDSTPKEPMTRSYVLLATSLMSAFEFEPIADDVPIMGGTKLKSFVDSCVAAGLSDVRASLSPSHVLKLLLRALDSDDFEIHVRKGRRYLCSSKRLELRRGIRFRVKLDSQKTSIDWSSPAEWWE